MQSNGWDDIGYNFLVDRFGQIFEGRYGGIDRNVIGAHAQGFNTASVGVALIGTYSAAAPTTAARDALARLLAWRLDVAHVDPLSTLTYASGGNPKYAPATPVFIRAVAGHRDTGFTTCPGDRVYGLAARDRSRRGRRAGCRSSTSPASRAGSARSSASPGASPRAVPWRVDVADQAGVVVESGSGTGTRGRLDLGRDADSGGHVSLDDGAGPTVRPATGVLGGGTAPQALTVTATRSADDDLTGRGRVRRFGGRSATGSAALPP